MKKLVIILLSALSLTAFAQQKKVAVYVTSEQTNISKILGDQLVSAFSQSGDYVAIERTSAFLAELGKEQKYQRTGAVDDSDISRLGKQFGVQQVCVADISELFGEKYVSARLIDVESAEIVKSANASGQMQNMSDLLNISQKLVSGLVDGANFSNSKNANTIEQGCARIGELTVVVEGLTEMSYSDAVKYAKNSFAGNHNDWRLPTKMELTNLLKQSVILHQDNADFPDLTQQYKTDDKGRQYCRYWCQDKDYYENGTFGHGTVAEPTAKSLYVYPSVRMCLVLLVRDNK